MSIFVIAEIGINHNGDLSICKELIEEAVNAGCDAVKFQKRDINLVYTKEFLESPRNSPWGTTQRDQKNGLEFEVEEFLAIDKFCKEKKHTFISTGMSTMEDIERAVNIFREENCPFELMHTVSTYPMRPSDANLSVIQTLKERFGCNVGYSGHEVGLAVSYAAAALGISSLERHITLDRSMYGSDQSSSVEPQGLRKLITDIRVITSALGDGIKRISSDEAKISEKLRQHIEYD